MIYLITSSIFLGLMGIVWDRKTVFNLFLKITFVGLSLWGGFLALGKAGYIVQV